MVAFVFLLGFTGCSLSGDDDGDSGPTVVNPPANAAAFNGVSISFNPTISFNSNGTVHEFSYSNNLSDSSLFPSTNGTALTGSYTYSVVEGSRRRIDFVFADTTKNFSIELQSFIGFGRLITGFIVRKVGDAANTAYTAQVANGSLQGAESTTGGETQTGGEQTTTPAGLVGKVFDLTFAEAPVYSPTPKVPSGFPYKEGDVLKFTFSSSNILTVGDDYRSLGTPRKYEGSPEYVWYDSVHKLNYCVLLKEDGTLYKIKVRADSYVYSDDDQHASYFGMFYIPVL